MCGIAGIIGTHRVNPAAVSAMTDLQDHRGPDDSGSWASADGKIVFGHRRLSVIDPTPAAHQPMVDPDGRFVLSFNGEIYNYVEIAARLRREGVEFNHGSDTAVLLEAFRRWGTDCLSELNGMFAFALYDGVEGKLYCGRDRFGEKPLLFAHGEGFFAFASEYKALLSLAEVSTDTDMVRLARFLHQPRLGLDDGRNTVFKDIHQLQPGELLTLDTRSLDRDIVRYWNIAPDSDIARLDEADAVSGFRDLLIDAVRLRMRSDVALGSCLSGGLDSTSIVCIARRLLGDDVPYHVFTGRFPGTGADEWNYAETVIDHAAVEAHVTAPDVSGFMDELAEFIWHNELPVGSASQYAQWCVFKLARENGITVLLDGQGADEILGGYEQYFRIYLDELRGNDPAAAAKEMHAILERYPLAMPSRRERLSRALPPALRRYMARITGRGSDALFGLDPVLAAAVTEDAIPVQGPFSGLKNSFYDDAFHTHLPTLLRYGDRNSMAHSREVRLPFCDHRIAEFVFSLPPAYLMGGAQTKRLLREAMRGIVPETIRTRWNKQGFLPPQEQWFHERLGSHAEALFEDPGFAASGLWNVPWWRQAVRRLRRGENHLAWTLWRPVIAEAWRMHFVDRARGMRTQSAFA